MKDLKTQVNEVIAKRGLGSCMNNTKWCELREGMVNEMPFPPPFILKTVLEETCPDEPFFQSDVSYWGDWGEDFLCYPATGANRWFVIEWVKVRPRYLERRGRLLAPRLIDASAQFEAILRKYHIPFERQDDVYCIYGYR